MVTCYKYLAKISLAIFATFNHYIAINYSHISTRVKYRVSIQ